MIISQIWCPQRVNLVSFVKLHKFKPKNGEHFLFFFIFWPFWRSLWPWTVSKVINQYIFFYFLSQTTFVSNFMTLPFIVPEFIILPFWGCQLWVEKWPKGVKAGACGLFHMILTAVFTGLTQTTIFGLDVYNKRFVQCPKTDCFSDPRKAHIIQYFFVNSVFDPTAVENLPTKNCSSDSHKTLQTFTQDTKFVYYEFSQQWSE